MTIYVVLRICEKHAVGRDYGPPIGVYFSPQLAASRIEEWYETNNWDRTTYTIRAMEVQGDPKDFDGTVFVVIKICEESFEYGSDCGPPVGVFFSEDAAIGNVRNFKRENPHDTTMFLLKNMTLRGERRNPMRKWFIGKMLRITDEKDR